MIQAGLLTPILITLVIFLVELIRIVRYEE
jgi:hypothetical protein